MTELVLCDNNWWPGQIVVTKVRTMKVKHKFKPVSKNKFKYLEKPQLESIPIENYLSVLSCDPTPDQTACCPMIQQ